MSATLPEQLSEPTRAFAGRDFGAAADGRTFDTLDRRRAGRSHPSRSAGTKRSTPPSPRPAPRSPPPRRGGA